MKQFFLHTEEFLKKIGVDFSFLQRRYALFFLIVKYAKGCWIDLNFIPISTFLFRYLFLLN